MAQGIEIKIKTIIGSDALNNNYQAKPNDAVVSTPEANKVKLYQYGNVNRPKARTCWRWVIRNNNDPQMEDPHSPSAFVTMSKLLNTKYRCIKSFDRSQRDAANNAAMDGII
jgi:hypothetical protein